MSLFIRFKRFFRRIFYRRYIVSYYNKKNEVCTSLTFALTQYGAIKKLKLFDRDIISITKLCKRLGDEL